MIKKKINRETEARKNMRGGEGEAVIRHYFKKDEINAPCRLCSELFLAPGAGIGLHDHLNEDEIFIIQQGRALVIEEGKEIELGPGDSTITGQGASHAIKNIGDTDLLVTAIIIQYSK